MKSTLLKGLSVIMLLGLILSACGGGAPAAEETSAPTEAAGTATEAPAEVSGGVLSIGVPIEPETLDPGDAIYVQEQFILMNLFDSLLAMGPDGELYPALATEWTPNEDYSEFTFKLREDVTFHDGTPFNAEAVKISFDHINSESVLESGGKSLLTDHSYVETVVVDDFTVTVKFGASYPTFLRDAARQWLSISSPAALEQFGAEYGRNPVGTGPFKFVSWTPQSEIVIERNPDYNWAPGFAAHEGPAYLDQVVFRILPEAATRVTAFESGEILMAGEPPALDAIALGDAGTASVQNFAMPGIPAILMINSTKAPTDDINVRKAIIHAVNQEELAQTAFQSLGLPTYGTVSPTTWGFSEESSNLYRYDPEEAARLLEEAGWVDSNGDGIREKDGANLTLDWPDNPAWSEAFNELVLGYLTNAGFEVTYRSMDDGAAYEEILAGNYTFVYMYWVRADPSPLRYLFHSDNVNGNGAYTNFVSEDLDAALEAADVQTDEEARRQDYVTVQNIIMENALVLPMFNVNSTYLTAPSVQGFTFDVEGYPWLYDISISE
jgi:peptide/nickel transport system substrate-binding protein